MTKNFTTKAAKVLTIATLSAGTLIGAIALDTTTVSASSVSQISGDETKGKIELVTNVFPTFEAAQSFMNGQASQILSGTSYQGETTPEFPGTGYVVSIRILYGALVPKDQAIALANQVVAAADSAIGGTAPVTPAEPETPVVPEEPTIPVEPETPVTPEEPTVPTEPVTPVEPTTPTEPVTPDEPTTPTEPETPVTPVEPTAPTEPETPVTPTEPTTPTEPETPVTPTEPTTPTESETPVTPVEPTTPIEVSKNQKSSTTKEEIKKVIPDNSTEAIKKDVKTLPNTGDAGSLLSIIGSGLLSLGGYVALKRK
ncbi:TPA: LPXTG cell wall anchor domain-containing protein [Streptococcus suis]|uniref:LPXTG cell wall anchor domain-containing protein n=1 Tax=Streptococcus suis TaxID=1307 RepID=UPI0005CD441C|nr:LPXTG cell wall anchor domain-containing protein [Streptococcus suis]MDE1691899.1 LPXTG cell wall anchor domain-containing protein [Streptococcus suis]NQG47689.1 LPXTG cell wall anchor domain-containing protein [Streptococcus suis]NQK83034.1 LPXTG cell wall anchor domain-containing protein [Streptococcus suis]NQL60497.1 LPXTG cell wall anchor domain-containing protein [Streptococcus suis]NQM21914.1 LPXTG cell wall anchor domain-containing protein [Streptococcus suis]